MVYILLGAGFEEAEALVTADVLRRANIPVALAGIGGDAVTGSHGITVQADVGVEGVSLAAGDMVVLPGGMGGVASIEGSEAAMALIRQAAADETVMPWEPATVSPPMPVRVTGRLARRSTSAAVRASVVSKPAPNRM